MGTLDGKLVGPAFGGGTRDRTADLLHAMQALSQLSYTPIWACRTTCPNRRLDRLSEPTGNPVKTLAEWTGLEPATPGVTGRYSNQLNYHSSFTAYCQNLGVPTGIRTPVTAVKGRCPRPLDDGDPERILSHFWWRYAGSNRGPLACHASALPAELYPRRERRPHYMDRPGPCKEPSAIIGDIGQGWWRPSRGRSG